MSALDDLDHTLDEMEARVRARLGPDAIERGQRLLVAQLEMADADEMEAAPASSVDLRSLFNLSDIIDES